jgi:hypothetical protein
MPNFSDVEFEKRYKHFLQVQSEWLTLITDHQIFIDKNALGEECRPIGFITDKKAFQRAEHLLADWQSFADLAEEKRKARSIAITTNLYLPVPTLIVNPKHVTINRFRATATANHTREDILRRYEKQIGKLRKVPFAAGAIMSLEDEKKVFEEAAPGAMYRARTSNYSDIQVTARYTDDKKDEGESFRYGAHGMLIYGDNLNKERDIKLNVNSNGGYTSSYDAISPITCSVLPNAKLYTMEDVEYSKTLAAQRSSVAYTVNTRRAQFENRAKAKIAKAKDAQEARLFKAEIDENRDLLEKLEAYDWSLLDKKVAAGDTEQLTMPEIRKRYGGEEPRAGKNMRNMYTLLRELESNQKKQGQE